MYKHNQKERNNIGTLNKGKCYTKQLGLGCIQDMLSSNLNQETSYHDWGFSWVCSIPPDKCLDSTFINLPSKTLPIYHSSYIRHNRVSITKASLNNVQEKKQIIYNWLWLIILLNTCYFLIISETLNQTKIIILYSDITCPSWLVWTRLFSLYGFSKWRVAWKGMLARLIHSIGSGGLR